MYDFNDGTTQKLTDVNHINITSDALVASIRIHLASFAYEYYLVYVGRYDTNTNSTVSIGNK